MIYRCRRRPTYCTVSPSSRDVLSLAKTNTSSWTSFERRKLIAPFDNFASPPFLWRSFRSRVSVSSPASGPVSAASLDQSLDQYQPLHTHWTSISPSLMVSHANISTNSSTFCCVFESPSKPPDDCIISSYVDVAGVQCGDFNMLAGEQLRETWTNLSTNVGCRCILFPVDDRFNCGCSCIANVSCCFVAYCNTSGNSSLLSQSSFTNALYSGQTKLSTTWIVSGLTMLGAVSVVAVAFLVLAMRRFQRGKLRSATEEAREARTRRRTAAVEQCRCDRLLLDMLPASVAVSLKMGQTVDPETFDVASVYFSDIVGFNDVALSCETPLVVVRLLNQVFRYSPTHYDTDVKYHITFNCQYENMKHESDNIRLINWIKYSSWVFAFGMVSPFTPSSRCQWNLTLYKYPLPDSYLLHCV